MTISSRHALVADIGGTHARFAITDIDALIVSEFAALRVDAFASLEAAVAAYLASTPHRPSLACFAVAGPANEERIKLTNSSWSFTRDAIRKAAGVEFALFVNDYEALALSLPYLTPHDIHQIGGETPANQTTKVVVGPGTGLGVAALAWSPSGWLAIPTEGGHVSFAVEGRQEATILEKLRAGHDHVSAERLISGPGLATLYKTVSDLKHKPAKALTAPEIVQRALKGEDPIAEEVLQLFVTWLGRFAGDAALFFGARGGVYLGGGVPPKILDALNKGHLREAFEAKGRMSAYVRQIPTYVILAEDAGLRGAAVALSMIVPIRGDQLADQAWSKRIA